MTAPLSGIRVLDLSRLLPGPYATLLLADLGAEVIKVEDPAGGDYIRYFPPALDDAGGAMFHALNRGKRSVTIDLRSPEGRDALLTLAKSADVLVESFRPGVLEKNGVGPEALHAANPKLVVCRISGYGQSGPDAGKAGHDLNYAARAGVLGMMRTPDLLPVQVGDLAGGAWPAALQVLAALIGRDKSGEGAVIDVSMTDGAHAMLVMPLARKAVDDDEVIDAGADLLSGGVPCYAVYPTADGHLALGALEPKFWMAFCQAAGLEELMGDGLSTGEDAARVRAQVAERLAQKTCAEWDDILGPADCCAESVRAPHTAREEDPQLQTRPLVVDVTTGDRTVSLPATPLSLAGDFPSSPGPALGADNDALLDEKGGG